MYFAPSTVNVSNIVVAAVMLLQLCCCCFVVACTLMVFKNRGHLIRQNMGVANVRFKGY